MFFYRLFNINIKIYVLGALLVAGIYQLEPAQEFNVIPTLATESIRYTDNIDEVRDYQTQILGSDQRVCSRLELKSPTENTLQTPKQDLETARRLDLDIVYTYVNGSVTSHQDLKLKWFKIEKKLLGERILEQDSVAPGLSKDNNELCYSLRSVEKNMPWFEGNIHIVADQVPSWLDVKHPRVRIVPTQSIMKSDDLPTFSSHAIEANLHRIPELKDNYLYFNDDYMLGRTTTAEDFFTPEGCPVVYTDERSTTDQNVPFVNLHRKAMWNANSYLDHYGLKNNERYYLPHAPHLMVKSIVEDMWSQFPELYEEQSSHRFRDLSDVHPAYLYSMYLLEQPGRFCSENRRMKNRCLPREDFCIKLLNNNLKDVHGFFKEITSRSELPKFFSINDHTDENYEKQDLIHAEFANFLNGLFPQPSRFEKFDCSL
jgi:hypothetical protein